MTNTERETMKTLKVIAGGIVVTLVGMVLGFFWANRLAPDFPDRVADWATR